MSDPGGPAPAPAPPSPPPGETGYDIPGWMVGVAVAAVLVVSAAFVWILLGSSGHHRQNVSQPPPTSTHPTHHAKTHAVPAPAHWDPRIKPFARIAEQQRGLTFKHPVAVRFLSSAAFTKSIVHDSKLDQGDNVRQLRDFAALLRAFGLVGPGVDIAGSIKQFTGGDTLAYYSFDTKRVTVRGNQITPAVRSTLVHELTHALQDQHFHVGSRFQQLARQAKKGPDTPASSVLQAITEGDAEHVQSLYRGSLPPAQQAALDASQRREAAQARSRLGGVPGIITTLSTSPYTLGQALVTAADVHGGDASVNRLFRHPPSHETALLDPLRYLSAPPRTVQVTAPTLGSGEKEFEHGELGVLTWYFMLGERLPLQQALAAADGWGGDAFVGYTSSGTSCARIAYAGTTPRATDQMYAALQTWVAQAPAGTAQVRRSASGLTFQSCDPGSRTAPVHDTSQQAMTLVATRTYLGIGLVNSGLDEQSARCIAGRLVQVYPVSTLVDPQFGATDPSVQARIRQIAAGCR